MLRDIRLKRAASQAVRAVTENLESRVLFAIVVDVNATTLPTGPVTTIPNAGTLGGVFEAVVGGDTVPVIDRPLPNATAGTVGIRMDGNDFLRLVSAAGGSALTAPATITGTSSVSIEAWVWKILV
jgi:hypothetical protein